MRSARLVAAAAGPASLVCCWLLVSPLRAGEVRLVDGPGPERIVVEAKDATVDEVLAVLSKRFGFAVERSAGASPPVRFSGSLKGSLDELLERLLRHQPHIVVRTAEAEAGIGRVLLLDGKAAPAPMPTIAGPIAEIKAKLKARERERSGQ
jgi:hypothetical protein